MFSILLATAALNPEGLDQELPKPHEVVEETHQHDTQEHVRFLNKVYRLAIDGNHQEARSLLERSINASPNFLEARKLLALIFLWEDQPASALVQLDYVLEKRPRDIDAILLKGDALTEFGRCGEAIDYYTQAEDLGDSFKAQMGIAFCYAKSGEPIRALDKARSIRAENGQQQERLASFTKELEKLLSEYVINQAFELVEQKAYECAMDVLEEYLWGNPGDDAARLALARIYGLNDDFELAIEQVCCILEKEPDNTAALTLLADIYRWRGDFVDSIWLYRDLLLDSECTSDTASLGLAYSYLGIGNRSGAHAIACRLDDPQLFEAVEERPFIDATYRYLSDSQDLSISQSAVKYVWWHGNCVWDANYMHIDSQSPGFGGYLDQTYARVYAPLNLTLDLGIAAGAATVNGNVYPIGFAEALVRLPNSTLYQRGGYHIYKLTAEALHNRIRYWDYYANYTYNLTDRQFIGAFYNYQLYSDGNHINSIDAYYDILLLKRAKSGCACLPCNPELELRYDFNYQNAASNALLGYFSGKDYFENRLAFAFRFYNRENQLRLEAIPTLSYVSYRDQGRSLEALFFGGVANLHLDLTECLKMIAAGKWGKYPFDGPDEYDYQEYALRLIYQF